MLDYNQGINPRESSLCSPAYEKLLEQIRQRKSLLYDVTKQPSKVIEVKDGLESYSSTNMCFNDNKVKGSLMKRINKVKFYHTSNFHKRVFEVNYSRFLLEITESDLESSKGKVK